MKTPNERLSDDALRAQRESIRRGLLRTNTAAVAILLVVIAMALSAIFEADRAGRERARAVQAEQDARGKLWNSYEGQARGARVSPQAGHRFESLEALKNAAQIRPSLDLRNDAIASLTRADFRALGKLAPAQAAGLALDSRFERYAVADPQGHIQVRRRLTNELLLELPASTNKLEFIFSFSPDGRHLPVAYQGGNTCIWDLNRREVVSQFRVSRFFQTVDFSPDGRQVAVAEASGAVVLYDLSGSMVPKTNQSNLSSHGVRFGPDGKMLGIYSEVSNQLLITEAASGKVIFRLVHPNVVRAIAWDAGGKFIATACQDHNGYLWVLEQPDKPLRTFMGHQSSLSDVAAHPDGQLLLTSSWDGTTRLWDTITGQELARLTPGVSYLKCNSDGSLLAGYEGTNTAAHNLYEVAAGRAVHFLREPEPEAVEAYPGDERSSAIWEVNFSRDERLLVSAGKRGVRAWNLHRGVELTRLTRGEAFSAFFHPDGEHVITCGSRGLLRWQITWSGQEAHFSEPDKLADHGFPNRAAISQDGSVLGYGDAGSIYLLGREQSFVGWPNHQWVAVSRDGHWLAASAWANSGIRLWDVAKGVLVKELPSFNQAVLAFSPDNRWLASGSAGEYCFYDLTKCEITRRLPRPDTPYFQGMIAFSQDGQLVAVTRSLTQVQLLDSATLEEVARLDSPVQQLISWLAFSPSGDQLAVATETPFIQVWKLRWLRHQLAMLGLDWQPNEPRTARRVAASSSVRTMFNPPATRSPGARQPQMLALTTAGVVLAIGLAVFVLRRHQKLVDGYQALDDLAVQRAKDLETAQRELLHSEKMKALGTLAAGIAHDFNNLLSVIRLSNDVIGQEAGHKRAIREELESIENAVQQGRSVVRSMLGYSREAADKPCTYAVGDVLADTVALLSKQFLGGIVLTMDVERATPKVWGAPSRLEQILLNLIVNAAEAMKGHGRLLIGVKSRRLAAEENFVLRPGPAAEYVEVSVSDSGLGIASEILPRIFEPFFTTKSVGASPGTGLGLSTVYTISQQDHLGLSVHTTAGQGTTFSVWLPATDRSPRQEDRNPKEARNPKAESPLAR